MREYETSTEHEGARRGLDATITMLQLAEIAPRARVIIAHAIRLDHSPNTKARQNRSSETDRRPDERSGRYADGDQ